MDADERTSDLVRYTSVKLSTSNYMMFVVSFRNNVGSYGDAGTELINEVYYDFKKSFSFKMAMVTEPHMAVDGPISEIIRPWDVKLDNARLINDYKIWKESQFRYLHQFSPNLSILYIFVPHLRDFRIWSQQLLLSLLMPILHPSVKQEIIVMVNW